MLKNPATKYASFPPIQIPNRQWPNQVIRQAPIWMSTDLRDGNQALFEPMNVERKMRLFSRLVKTGFKEIEVAFPSASQTDYDFVRTLIEGGHIPDGVSVEVLAPAREALIRRTFEALKGAHSAIVHIYSATSPSFREMVFSMTKQEVLRMVVSSIRLVRELSRENPETHWTLEYSPENFTATELDYALEVCDAVTETWGATPDDKIILNLPMTVEMATPNVYADQIEWMHRRLDHRNSVLISLHPHNDRGTGVAAAELGLMAGADRVEGCLFGNGERTGNVDLVTLALNLYTQGISPNLDFSDINAIARDYEECTQMPIHPRHPSVGDLVFTAFSGSHQDAIRKGFAAQEEKTRWDIPYLPVDPADLGRNYDSVIRINSQSGKGGVAFLLEQEYGIVMPRRLQVEFSGEIQHRTDEGGGEIDAKHIWELFSASYLENREPLAYVEHHLFENGETQGIELSVEFSGKKHKLTGEGNGPIDAAVNALASIGFHVQVRSYEERSMSGGGNARACAFMEVTRAEGGREYYGVGMDPNIVTASIKALISGTNRLFAQNAEGAKSAE
ncbi:MAG: 2-isopropylmalate synthase [Candidatus Accumulibacter sp.]|nr:2-isopropylmalate synthase [Accumulibacter sp.]